MTDQRNLLVAILLSIVILLGFQYFYEIPRMEQRKAELAQQRAEEQARLPAPTTPEGVTAPGSPVPIPGATAPAIGAPRDRAEIVAAGQRVKIDTPRLHGTISTVGARVDDLTLADYHVTPDPGSPEIVLLSPAGTSQPYYAEFGWVPAAGTNQPVPGPDDAVVGARRSADARPSGHDDLGQRPGAGVRKDLQRSIRTTCSR